MNAKPTESEILAALARAPASAKFLEDERARVVAHRKDLLARRRQIETGAEAAWLKEVAAEEAAVAAVRAAERALRDANAKLGAANVARASGAHARRAAIEALDAELAAGADHAAISAFRDELYRALAVAQRPGALVVVEDKRRNLLSGRATLRRATNHASVAARIGAIADAIGALAGLKLEADQSRLPDRFAEIRASLPAIEQNPRLDPEAKTRTSIQTL